MPTDEQERLRRLIVEIAWKWYGTPYEYGGDNIFGADCSGAYSAWLRQVGIERPGFRGVTFSEDYPRISLSGIYQEVEIPLAGCGVFYGNDRGRISHVMMAISETHVIGSTGGDSGTDTVEEADAQDAYVKVYPIGYRTVIKIVDPIKWER